MKKDSCSCVHDNGLMGMRGFACSFGQTNTYCWAKAQPTFPNFNATTLLISAIISLTGMILGAYCEAI